jgi:hypothetical protein
MSLNAPSAPDPSVTSTAQQGYNLAAAKSQNQVNSYNQQNPYGSMSYTADPNSPSGYSLNTSLSPQQQGLLNTQVGTQGIAGQTGQDLLKNSAGMYSSPYDLNAATGQTANLLNKWQQQYVQPIFDQQSSNLEAQLRNQGLTPGSEAYNNAKNLLARNQGDVTNQYLTQNEGQAFGQALQNYQLPMQTAQSLYGMAAPTGPNFQQTPNAQIQPPNYAGQVQQNYQNQMQNYQNTWNNIGKLGAAGVGLAMAPMTGGTSLLAGGLGSMFGSSPTNLPQSQWTFG